MSTVVEFRHRATEFRHNAENSRNPLARLMHKKAAQRWDDYADGPDDSVPGQISLVRHQRAFSV